MHDLRPDPLDDAIAALRASIRDEALSSDVRSDLFSRIQGLESAPSGLFGFQRAWKVALVGAIPLLMVAVLLAPATRREGPKVQPGTLTATKVDGQVVFTLANGGQSHKVYLSTDPQRFDSAVEVEMVNDRFQVDATGGPDLVFYRID